MNEKLIVNQLLMNEESIINQLSADEKLTKHSLQ